MSIAITTNKIGYQLGKKLAVKERKK